MVSTRLQAVTMIAKQPTKIHMTKFLETALIRAWFISWRTQNTILNKIIQTYIVQKKRTIHPIIVHCTPPTRPRHLCPVWVSFLCPKLPISSELYKTPPSLQTGQLRIWRGSNLWLLTKSKTKTQSSTHSIPMNKSVYLFYWIGTSKEYLF